MNKYLKIFLIVVIVGIICGGIGLLYVFFKPHRNLANEKPDYVLKADLLLKQFTANEDSTFKVYDNKALEVNGKIADISKKGVSDITFILEDVNSGVSCSFDSTYISNNLKALKDYKIGDEISIKGQCDGFDPIMGVVLTKCVLAESN
jgi:hypothetical protein